MLLASCPTLHSHKLGVRNFYCVEALRGHFKCMVALSLCSHSKGALLLVGGQLGGTVTVCGHKEVHLLCGGTKGALLLCRGHCYCFDATKRTLLPFEALSLWH